MPALASSAPSAPAAWSLGSRSPGCAPAGADPRCESSMAWKALDVAPRPFRSAALILGQLEQRGSVAPRHAGHHGIVRSEHVENSLAPRKEIGIGSAAETRCTWPRNIEARGGRRPRRRPVPARAYHAPRGAATGRMCMECRMRSRRAGPSWRPEMLLSRSTPSPCRSRSIWPRRRWSSSTCSATSSSRAASARRSATTCRGCSRAVAPCRAMLAAARAARHAGHPHARGPPARSVRRAAGQDRARRAGLRIGDPGPMGRILVRGEPGHDIVAGALSARRASR